MSIKVIHQYGFEIDTTDWHSSSDADKCSNAIEKKMEQWTQEQAAKYHAALDQAQNEEIQWDDAKLEAVQDMCNDCASVILDTYRPDFLATMVGHNHNINAINILQEVADATLYALNAKHHIETRSTISTLDMYLRVSAALDTTKKNDMAYLLSRLSDDLATQYFTDTGTKVGSALGWDTGIDHSTVKSEGKS